MRHLVAALLLALPLVGAVPTGAGAAPAATQAPVEPMGIALENFDYPYPVQYLPLEIEGQLLRMGYMDVKPAKPNGRTVVLLHGKNFCGAYWAGTIDTLSRAGYRVVVPDQIGFGKSGKPDIHYSFHGLAANTRKLLDELGVKRAVIVGHSMGGMLATRFALLFPERTEALVLENPIGLEDYKVGVPWAPLDEVFQTELKATEAGIRAYHQTYYPGPWKPAYEPWVQIQAGWTKSGEFPRVAWSSALTYQMIYEQPVVYEFPKVSLPTLLIIGQEDRTVVGKGRIQDPAVKARMGNYPELGRSTAKAIPGAKLVELEGVGHIPHLQVPDRFDRELLQFLAAQKRQGSRK